MPVKINKKYLPFILIGFFILVFIAIQATKPSIKRVKDTSSAPIDVEIQTISKQPFPIYIESYGVADALTRTLVVSRVVGNVEFISESFREGAFFKKDELLVSLDKSDYQIELDVAKAQVAEAQSRYASEQALAEEARADWKRSGRKGEPPALAVRLPQLEAAAATLKSAEASVARAQLNLSRCDIRAPYDGSVINTNIALGQFVGTGATVGEIFSSSIAEIRLPIQNEDATLLGINSKSIEVENGPSVDFVASTDDNTNWSGNVVRISSALDSQTRQVHVIARIESPFLPTEGKEALKVGSYLKAKIQGLTIEGAIVIPVSAIYQGRYVFVYEKNVVNRRDIEITWSDTNRALIQSGLSAGEKLVTTALGQLPSGTPAEIAKAPATKFKNSLKAETTQ